jgi:hypothetical protein
MGSFTVVQVFHQFSAQPSDVRHRFMGYYRLGPEIDQHEWVQLLPPFTAVQTLHVERSWVDHDPPAPEDVIGEMVTEAEILPVLGLIYLGCPHVAFLALKFFENFVAVRSLSSRPITAVTCEREFDERVRSLVRNRDYQIHSPFTSGPRTLRLCNHLATVQYSVLYVSCYGLRSGAGRLGCRRVATVLWPHGQRHERCKLEMSNLNGATDVTSLRRHTVTR